jgi:hypothetical protein
MGERKESVISTSLAVACASDARSEYVRFVVDASYFAPWYAGYAMV